MDNSTWFHVVLSDENSKAPTRADIGAAGYDLYSCEFKLVPAHGQTLVNTGIRVSISPSTYLRVAPRSGMALKQIHVGAGVVDSSYTGIVKVLLINMSSEDYVVEIGDRIAQGIIERIDTPPVTVVSCINDTSRGERGFGSSGK